MAPPLGSKNGTKLKDPEVRQDAYRQYCEHIASGYPKEAFFFDHPIHSVTFETMDRYIAESPDEFDPYAMKKAMAQRYKYWLEEGHILMKGKYPGGSPVVWQTIMRNIFKHIGWDREQITEANKSHVARLAGSIRAESVEQTEDGDKGVEGAD